MTDSEEVSARFSHKMKKDALRFAEADKDGNNELDWDEVRARAAPTHRSSARVGTHGVHDLRSREPRPLASRWPRPPSLASQFLEMQPSKIRELHGEADGLLAPLGDGVEQPRGNVLAGF